MSPVPDLEQAIAAAAVRALRRRASELRRKAAPGVTALDGYRPVVLVVASESAHALKIAKSFDQIADAIEAEGVS